MENSQLNNPDFQHKDQGQDTNKKPDSIELNTQFDYDKYNIGPDDFKAEKEKLIKKGEEAKERQTNLFPVEVFPLSSANNYEHK